MNQQLTRRTFLIHSAIAATGALALGCQTRSPRRLSANEKLNIGVIGTANRARANISGVEGENIVALCDVDDNFLAALKPKYPGATTYNDFRKMLERDDLDAVVVSTADHAHAAATSMALQLGKHVYCEKPLTHTVYEARRISKLAARNPKLATQMGTQIHAGDNYRRVVELIESGVIGAVAECHVWCEKSLHGGDRPQDRPPVPAGLHWDLWLGPAPARPYHPEYLPKTWRRWWAFGEGILGDMACHYMDLPFWALKLKYPTTIRAEGPPPHPETVPAWMIVQYNFPARLDLPEVKLTWYDGGKVPALVAQGKAPNWRNGVLFVGSKGMLIADYGRRKLLPEAQFAGFQPPAPFIADSVGHHREWLNACKTGSPTTCNFEYASRLTEAVLLGIVAYRSGEALDWNGYLAKLRKSVSARNYLRTEYRHGWDL